MLPGIKVNAGFIKYRGLNERSGNVAVLAISNNYQYIMSGMQVNAGINLVPKIVRSTVFGDSAGRYQNSFRREWYLTKPSNYELNQTDVNTILLIGVSNDTDLVYPSAANVNNVDITLTNWFANGCYVRSDGQIENRSLEVSYAYYYDTFENIKYVAATFDGPGTGANEFAGATIMVLPGKWVPSDIVRSPANTTINVAMSNTEIGLYFGSHEQDTNMVDVTVNTGIQIGYNSGNWYGGQSVGLLYSNTGSARVDVVDNNKSSTKDRCIIAKLSWSP